MGAVWSTTSPDGHSDNFQAAHFNVEIPKKRLPLASQPQGLHTDPFITMSRYVSFRDFDWWLLLFVLIICGLGVLEIRSATAHTKLPAPTSSRCTGSVRA